MALNHTQLSGTSATESYTHLIPERRNTTFLWVGNWIRSPEIKWKSQTQHSQYNSLSFSTDTFSHFICQTSTEISQSTSRHNSQFLQTLGLGWLWLWEMLKSRWVRFLLRPVLSLLHAVKTKKSKIFSNFRKSWVCFPGCDKILTLAADFIGRLCLLQQSKFATSCVFQSRRFNIVRTFKIV